nr:MAG TPA: hypothetical protein [Caudoviricetes sp.]
MVLRIPSTTCSLASIRASFNPSRMASAGADIF